MEQHKTIVFEEHTLHYRDEGREHEQTLVLLHGYLQNLDIWSSYVLSYMRSMHVITIDLPGHAISMIGVKTEVCNGGAFHGRICCHGVCRPLSP